MADDIVIRAEGLGKKYTIGHQSERERYTALRDVMARGARNLWRKTADLARGRAVVAGDRVEEFWALKDVSFEVRRGEVLGIIGRNGAGKSTLLKILSRITEPSEGRVTIKGRVASLLEVGTGFHPELTGRENIYLNGAILGMTRAEIRRKFDEIVDFAGVEKFLDTPVKRYSSGMYVRLAFAVAAHLEPEILVIDEVLAVGDAEFQKKCLGKMGEVAGGGRTVLFVSHNMSAIAELANHAILLDYGFISERGPVPKVTAAYLGDSSTRPIYIAPCHETRKVAYVARAEVDTSNLGGVHYSDRPLKIKVWVRHPQGSLRGCLGVQIINQYNISATNFYAYPPDCVFGNNTGTTLVQFSIPKIRLHSGLYHLRIWLTEPEGILHDKIDKTCVFKVLRTMKGLTQTWSADACIYHETFSVQIRDHKSGAISSSATILGNEAG